MLRLIYVSEQSSSLSNNDIKDIVRSSSANNQQSGITGLLMVCDQHFFQVLEGPAEAVDQLLARVRRDRRHNNLKVLSRSTVMHRLFDDWSMEVCDLACREPLQKRLIAAAAHPGTDDARAEIETALRFMEAYYQGCQLKHPFTHRRQAPLAEAALL